MVSGGEGETPKKKEQSDLKRRSAVTAPTVWIGKNGVTKTLLSQIGTQLDAKEMVKVKVQRSSLEDTEVGKIAGEIADETRSEIVDVRGRTFSVYKPRKKGLATRKTSE